MQKMPFFLQKISRIEATVIRDYSDNKHIKDTEVKLMRKHDKIEKI